MGKRYSLQSKIFISLLLLFLAACAAQDPAIPSQNEAPPTVQELSQAVLSGDVKKVKTLIVKGADIHGLDTELGGPNGRRPLNFAALQNDLDMITALLELGADINRQNLSGFTPMHHAVEYNSLAAIQLLIDEGADPTIKNNAGLSPAQLAGVMGNSEAAKTLELAVKNKK